MVKNILHMTDEEKKQLMENLRQRFQGKENPFQKFRNRKQKESEVVDEKPIEKEVEMIEENINEE